jgi:hypothetical protein
VRAHDSPLAECTARSDTRLKWHEPACRTFTARMSALGQNRSFDPDQANVRFAPEADIPFRLCLVTRGAVMPEPLN